MRAPIVLVAVVTTAAVLAGCAALFGGDRVDERFARPDHPRTSPSGRYVARVDLGPEQNGVPTWRVVITDRTGREVFRDSDVYSSRHGVGVTWLHGTDQLWLISSDVGTSSAQLQADGTWTKTAPRPGHFDQDVPAEIRELAGR